MIRVPACARVSCVSRVCPGSPRCLFTGTLPGRPSPNTAPFIFRWAVQPQAILSQNNDVHTPRRLWWTPYTYSDCGSCVHGYSCYNIGKAAAAHAHSHATRHWARATMARRQPPARTTQISELSLYDAGNCEALRSSRVSDGVLECAGWCGRCIATVAAADNVIKMLGVRGVVQDIRTRNLRRPSTAEANQRRRAGAAISASRGANALAERAWDTEPAQAARD